MVQAVGDPNDRIFVRILTGWMDACILLSAGPLDPTKH